jgi:hypothetical protein
VAVHVSSDLINEPVAEVGANSLAQSAGTVVDDLSIVIEGGTAGEGCGGFNQPERVTRASGSSAGLRFFVPSYSSASRKNSALKRSLSVAFYLARERPTVG